jgi:rhodanese-related sulfurtransferase
MPQQISVGYKALLAEAEREIEQVSIEQAIAMAGRGDAAIIDIRDVRELWREGRIPGSVHVPRGMLEFWIDPESPYHKAFFTEDKTFIFHCAGGLRSMLATQIAQRMGLKPVYNMIGGFAAWKEAGGPVEPVEPKHK